MQRHCPSTEAAQRFHRRWTCTPWTKLGWTARKPVRAAPGPKSGARLFLSLHRTLNMRVCQVPCLRPDRSSTSSCFCNAHRRSEAEVGGPRDTILSIRMSIRPQQAVLDFRLKFFHHSSSTMQLQRDLYQQSPICRNGPAQRAMTPVKSFFGGYSFLPCTWGIQEAPQEKHGIPLCPPCLRRPSVVCVAGMHTRPTAQDDGWVLDQCRKRLGVD